MGVALGVVRGGLDAEAFEQPLEHPLPVLGVQVRPVAFQWDGEVRLHGSIGVERVPGVLVGDLERAAHPLVGDLGLAGAVVGGPNVLAAISDCPTGRSFERDCRLAERGLATARLANDAKNLVPADVDVDFVENSRLATLHAEDRAHVAEFDDRVASSVVGFGRGCPTHGRLRTLLRWRFSWANGSFVR